MKKREIPVMNVGISLIILIFMNICLAAFAVLSLEIKVKTVKNMQKQSQKDIKKVAKSQIKLTESVSKSQQLVVTLQLDETGGYPQYYIQKWKLCSSDDWQADDSLDVYQSGE